MRKSGIDSAIQILLDKAPSQELDYGFVMDCLKSYHNPRVKLHHLLKVQALIRVKKGIYVFAPNLAKFPYSLDVLANMIYGPSYISLEWACQHYRLIPERVTTITSVTTQRSRQFQTPVGYFTYNHLSMNAFSVGMTRVSFSDKQHALIATKEKALVDLLVIRRGSFSSKKHFKETLFDDLRIEKDDVTHLNLDQLQTIYEAYPHRTVKYLIQLRETIDESYS